MQSCFCFSLSIFFFFLDPLVLTKILLFIHLPSPLAKFFNKTSFFLTAEGKSKCMQALFLVSNPERQTFEQIEKQRPIIRRIPVFVFNQINRLDQRKTPS